MTVVMTGQYMGNQDGKIGFSQYGGMSKPDVYLEKTKECNQVLEKGVLYDVACDLVKTETGICVKMKGVQVHG